MLLCLASTQAFTSPDFLLEACLTAGVTIVTIGLLYQYLHLISRKFGSVYLILLFFIVVMIPVFVGAMLRQPRLSDFHEVGKALLMSTPVSQPLRWMNLDADKIFFDISPFPVIIGYSIASLFLVIMTGKWLAARVERVEKTKARLLDVPQGLPEAANQGVAEVVAS